MSSEGDPFRESNRGDNRIQRRSFLAKTAKYAGAFAAAAVFGKAAEESTLAGNCGCRLDFGYTCNTVICGINGYRRDGSYTVNSKIYNSNASGCITSQWCYDSPYRGFSTSLCPPTVCGQSSSYLADTPDLRSYRDIAVHLNSNVPVE